MSRDAVAEEHRPSADSHSSAHDAPVVEPVSEDGRPVSEDVYWRDYYDLSDIHYEWNNGRLEEKPVSDYATYLVYRWLIALLGHFLEVKPIAATIALEMGFRLALPEKVVIRKPDFGVVRLDNARPLQPRDNTYPGVFDLCIEALSDLERKGIERDAVTKKQEYAAGGVPEYYIVHRERGRMAFFARGDDGLYQPMEPVDDVIASRVLPGFRFRIADLLTQPSPSDLRDDPVYADFVLPGWRAAEQRAAAEAERAAEEQRARLAAEARARAAEESLARLRRERGRD
ncbi:hypothetical protein CKO31_05220 [Thiohalocapsa halophila]|uniref:Putative restriction endonuclease domain-containing protein n=2 Tax=Thiohalocapsa halophila TaxID=69359 RepID=A0ABS1CE23_9GAMM|nr:hypothetical protein [Thiohalocapsa halophila]